MVEAVALPTSAALAAFFAYKWVTLHHACMSESGRATAEGFSPKLPRAHLNQTIDLRIEIEGWILQIRARMG